jgi:hypothetical protein
MRWILLLCACFPYRETYRPAVDGVVVDGDGAPAAAVRIEACSRTHWSPECKFRGRATADALGRFHFSAIKKWDWCCFGEAPLPSTTFAACGDGRVGLTSVDYRTPQQSLRLVLAPGGDELCK